MSDLRRKELSPLACRWPVVALFSIEDRLMSIRQALQSPHTADVAVLDAILVQMPVGLVIAVLPDLRITHVCLEGRVPPPDLRSNVEGLTVREYMQQWPVLRLDGHPAEFDELPMVRAARGEIVRGEEWIVTRPDGTRLNAKLSAAPVKEAQGEIVAVILTWTDVTDLRVAQSECQLALDRNRLLLREVNHRVTNSLNIIASMLAIRSKLATSGDVKHAFEDAGLRVQRVARLHERLYQSERYETVDFSDYLRVLVDDLRGSIIGNVALRIECARTCFLPTDMVVPLAMIIGELVTNALKHAFRDGRDGTVVVRFASSDDGSAVLEVTDNGAGMPKDFKPDHAERMGMQLVIRLTRQLKADLEIVDNEPGARIIITLPKGSARPE